MPVSLINNRNMEKYIVALAFLTVYISFLQVQSAATSDNATSDDAIFTSPTRRHLLRGRGGAHKGRKAGGAPHMITVASDGTGNYKTINEAVNIANANRKGVHIYIKKGYYQESVKITAINVKLTGDGIGSTVIAIAKNGKGDNWPAHNTAVVEVTGAGFYASGISFENLAPPYEKGVAMMVSGDAVFHKCSFKGHQDTLYLKGGRQFLRECDIYGTVDFIFGFSAAYIQRCNIFIRRTVGPQTVTITAQNRDKEDSTGFVFQNSRILLDGNIWPRPTVYLGRPWGPRSRVVFMNTEFGDLIDPLGWTVWDATGSGRNGDLVYYGEYSNTGRSADTSRRAKMRGFHAIRDTNEASKYSLWNFLSGFRFPPGVPTA